MLTEERVRQIHGQASRGRMPDISAKDIEELCLGWLTRYRDRHEIQRLAGEKSYHVNLIQALENEKQKLIRMMERM